MVRIIFGVLGFSLFYFFSATILRHASVMLIFPALTSAQMPAARSVFALAFFRVASLASWHLASRVPAGKGFGALEGRAAEVGADDNETCAGVRSVNFV